MIAAELSWRTGDPDSPPNLGGSRTDLDPGGPPPCPSGTEKVEYYQDMVRADSASIQVIIKF